MGCLFDTNGIVYFLDGKGRFPQLLSWDDIKISCITKIELLSGRISDSESERIRKFLKNITILDLNDAVLEKSIDLRKTLRLKLPDAVIATTAIVNGLNIITADKEIIKKLTGQPVAVINPLAE